ncbi:hypothetical protein OG976_15575 [Mycobacterium sp. NBC_00419]|uniref:hypothetical protein n=1 Tax=Mycobacterium sp. NBC_00419 TaxID=2975989 RepID=UPI002E22BF1C
MRFGELLRRLAFASFVENLLYRSRDVAAMTHRLVIGIGLFFGNDIHDRCQLLWKRALRALDISNPSFTIGCYFRQV